MTRLARDANFPRGTCLSPRDFGRAARYIFAGHQPLNCIEHDVHNACLLSELIRYPLIPDIFIYSHVPEYYSPPIIYLG